MSLTNTKNYNNPTEVSNAIATVSESIEQIKFLYNNLENSNEQAIFSYEKEIRELKWNIINYLSDDNNFILWQNSNKNNAALFFKYYQKNHFDHEIGHDQELRIKILTQLQHIFTNTPTEYLLTNREKQLLKNNSSINLDNEEQLVLNLFNEQECFDKNYSYLMSHLPDNKKLPKEAQNAIELLKKNPLLLADNPHHFVINRNRNKFPTVSCHIFEQLLLDATVGDLQAINTLKKMKITYEQLNAKESQTENIVILRKEANEHLNTFKQKVNKKHKY